MFQPPETTTLPARPKPASDDRRDDDRDDDGDGGDEAQAPPPQPRRTPSSQGRRRRRRATAPTTTQDDDDSDGDGDGNATRRRRRRARSGEGASSSPDDPENTVVKVREGRSAEDEITGVSGSTRLEAKKQRRREGREAGRRRAPIVSEAEFLARRESVKREMVVRQRDDYTQIAVLEDSVLVEHYVARESQTSLIGNVYLGKVQNVLPSMEAAFIDIGAGRNAVLYAGEVDWSTLGNGKQRKIEDALTPGQTVLVQATKDPVGQKGARLTSQVSLPGRFLVYVPRGQTSGISRKLPENERSPPQGPPQGGAARGRRRHRAHRRRGRHRGPADPRRHGPQGPLGGHREEGRGRQGARAALRRARPDDQGRPRPLQRGLRLARRRG